MRRCAAQTVFVVLCPTTRAGGHLADGCASHARQHANKRSAERGQGREQEARSPRYGERHARAAAIGAVRLGADAWRTPHSHISCGRAGPVSGRRGSSVPQAATTNTTNGGGVSGIIAHRQTRSLSLGQMTASRWIPESGAAPRPTRSVSDE